MSDRPTSPGTSILLETLPNLRDLGGYEAAGDQKVRSGRLYRSVLLGRLNDTDLATVRELGLKKVFDFRTAAEREASPDRDVGATEVGLDVLADRTGTGPSSLLAKMDDPVAVSAALEGGKGSEMMLTAYRELIELPSANRSFGRFFREIADQGNLPALFHCTTGKDRTGWAAAATLLFLGVSEEDVFSDYLLTNELLLPALKPLFAQFESVGIDPALLRPVLGVKREYLETALGVMDERFGSIDGYMSRGLGLGDDVLEALRSALLTVG